MTFNFHLSRCASSNSNVAKLREGMRMACLALGMERIGRKSVIVDVSPELQASPRWKPFAHLLGKEDRGVHIHPAESLKGSGPIVDVGFKCSVGTDHDHQYLNRCRLLVAHEYNQHFHEHANLLPVPFMVHDSVMDVLLDTGLFEAFISNDLKTIRDSLQQPKTELLGMRACMHHHRQRFIEDAPKWTDLALYTHQPTGGFEPWDHVKWITKFRGGLCLPGTTPKTNLPSLLALLGVAIVTPPFPESCRDTPPLTKRNAIIFESWEQVRSELEDEQRLADVLAQATGDYCNSWSAMGQSRLIAERFS